MSSKKPQSATTNIPLDQDPSEPTVPQKSEPKKEDVLDGLNPKSFFTLETIPKAMFNLTAPFPTEIPYERLITKFSENMLDGYLVKDKEGVFSTDKNVVKKQSGLIKEVVNQLTKSLMKGGGSMGLSLPVRIFEPRTMLERITDWWAFAPIILKKAGCCTDKVEAFKQVICFSLSALFRSSQQLKPFNPMLGETYQAFWEDGTKIYLEHTSHIPPVSHFYIKDSSELFTLSGYFDMELEGMLKSVLTNTMGLIPKGKITVYLPGTKQTISFQFPKVTVGGVILGERYVLFNGHMKFEDRENGLKAIIAFNKSRKEIKNKRVHDIYGRIFKYTYKDKEPFYEDHMHKHPFGQDKSKEICEITGSWLEEIYFGDKMYWSIKNSVAPQIYPEKEVLPSDSRYREDRTWMRKAWDNPEYEKLYEQYAQNWKLALEAQQRYERGLRKPPEKKGQ